MPNRKKVLKILTQLLSFGKLVRLVYIHKHTYIYKYIHIHTHTQSHAYIAVRGKFIILTKLNYTHTDTHSYMTYKYTILFIGKKLRCLIYGSLHREPVR